MSQSSPPPAARSRWLPPSLILLGSVAVAVCLLLSAPRVENAQTEGASVHYGAGWNLVSAPSGTELQGTSGTQYSYAGASQSYVPVNPGEMVAGHGAWAFFKSATNQPLGSTAGNYSRVFAKANTWVMAGNPSSTLTLPISGADLAEAYDPAQQNYVMVTSLAPGQGAWVLRFTDGFVLIGTQGTDALTLQAQQIQMEMITNPTDRNTLNQAATVSGELLARRSYDAVQSETDNFRAAAEEGVRDQGASTLGEMTPAETQATREVRTDLALAQEAVSAGNSAGADMQVMQALQEATAAQTDGMAVAKGRATATPGPGDVTLRYDDAFTPAELAEFYTYLRTGFLSLGLGQPFSDAFWSVALALLNGTLPPPTLPSPASTVSSTAPSAASPSATATQVPALQSSPLQLPSAAPPPTTIVAPTSPPAPSPGP